MPRTLNPSLLSAMLSENGNIIAIWIAEITHEDMTEVYRIADNTEDIIGPDGETYTGLGFDFDPPEDSEEGFKTAKITMNNVERWFTEKMRELSGTFYISLKLVTPTDLSASPPVFGNTEISVMPMKIMAIDYDENSVTATLSHPQIQEKKIPMHKFSPQDFPGLF